MKAVGIIAEYDPFHRGHEYHIKKARELTGADYVVVVMSGDFTQRGTPAIVDKYARAEMALRGGADLVLELPTAFACSSAEHFASAAVAMLDKLGVVTHLCFGSECGDISALTKLAEVLVKEPEEFRQGLKEMLRQGYSYPNARNMALIRTMGVDFGVQDILTKPNNILALEYIKAIRKRNSRMIPVTAIRAGEEYHSTHIPETDVFPSALAIRTSLVSGRTLQQLRGQLPEYTYEILAREEAAGRFPMYRRNLSPLLQYKLLCTENRGFTAYSDVSPELSNKIRKELPKYQSYDDFCDRLKSKDITYVRVCRALLHIMLDITEEMVSDNAARDYGTFAPVLGFKKESGELMKAIKQNSALTLITKNADAGSILSAFDLPLFEDTIRCSHIYECILWNKFHGTVRNMYQTSPIIL